MKRITIGAIAAVVAGFTFMFGAQSALADDCLALSGAPAGATCLVNTTRVVTGTFNLDETLEITGAGSIDAGGGGITLNICVAPATPSASCDLLVDKPTLAGGGVIKANDTGATSASASNITIHVSRNVIMQAGTQITADNTNDGGNAGNIAITAGGDMTMCGQTGAQPGCGAPGANPGAFISAQKMSGGTTSVISSVTITVGDKATATGRFYMEGGSTAYGTENGALIDTTSTTGHAGNIDVTAGKSYFTEPGAVIQAGGHNQTATAQGGKIFLVSDCGLTTEGRVSSKGPDFGADLVHLESCEVIIRGLVESTGKGHVTPGKNSCNNVADGLPGEVLRAGKPPESTGCIEVWGNFITIDSTVNQNVHWAGEVNADIGNGGANGTSWIDIFAFSKLTVIDGTGNDFERDNNGHTYFSTYAVHANAIDGSDANPSVITAKVKNGPLTASSDGTAGGGRAFEASSTMTDDTGHGTHGLPADPDPFVGNGSHGGTIDLEASGTVTLDTAWINASGDFDAVGGHIIVSAWGAGSNLSWQNGVGDVRPVASGAIDLNAPGSITTTGTEFYSEVPTQTNTADATKPDIPVITAINGGPVFKPDFWALCGGSSISGVKFDDKNGNGSRNAGDVGLNGWVIHLFGTDASGPVHLTQTTHTATAADATCTLGTDGCYYFAVPPGLYTICEELKSGPPAWKQTFPTSGHTCTTAEDSDNLTPGPLGYTVDLCSSCATGTCSTETLVTGKDFGNIQLAIKTGTKFNDLNGINGRDSGEPGLNTWVIHLFGTAVDGSAVHTTSTTANDGVNDGVYKFTVLPGSYTVCEQLKTGWTQTFPTSGADCVTPGDPAADNPTPGPVGYSIVLIEGQTDGGNDFGNQTTTTPKGSKSGRKFNDITGTPGLNGWTIHLFGNETAGGLAVHTTQVTHTATAADVTCTLGAAGCYYFGNLNPGTYHVCEQLVSGWTQTFPTSGFNCVGADPNADNPTPGALGYTFTITAAGENDTGNDFGNVLPVVPPPGSVSGNKFEDVNGINGRDPGEPGLTGVQIHLLNTDTLADQHTLTDVTGHFSFGNVPVGNYIVCEQGGPPTQTFPLADGSGGLCAAHVGVTGSRGYAITVVSSQDSGGNDFGNHVVKQPPPPSQIPTLDEYGLLALAALLGLAGVLAQRRRRYPGAR